MPTDKRPDGAASWVAAINKQQKVAQTNVNFWPSGAEAPRDDSLFPARSRGAAKTHFSFSMVLGEHSHYGVTFSARPWRWLP